MKKLLLISLLTLSLVSCGEIYKEKNDDLNKNVQNNQEENFNSEDDIKLTPDEEKIVEDLFK